MPATRCSDNATPRHPVLHRVDRPTFASVINTPGTEPTRFGAMLINILPGFIAIDEFASFLSTQDLE